MSIIVDENTKLIVQGITGREGSFHTELMQKYGTKVVAGVTPGKEGESMLGVPIFNSVRRAAEKTGANATLLFVPAQYTEPALTEAIDSGVPTIITIAEHIPVQVMMRARHDAKGRGVTLVGPNGSGVISPGKCKVGFMPDVIFRQGNVGILTRSASNSYETVISMSNKGLGQSTCVGLGGDMIPGSTFSDLLGKFEEDAETEVIVLIGEIGGTEEEEAAAYIKRNISKPCVAMIAGKSAPKGRSMGHAGAIIGEDGSGSAENKEAALRDAGAYIAESPQDIVRIVSGLV